MDNAAAEGPAKATHAIKEGATAMITTITRDNFRALIKQPGKGTSGIDALNLGHMLVLLLILTSNIILLIIKYL
jgi:hypothetical protein